MTASIDLFRSPRRLYSSLAMPGACKLGQVVDVDLRLRPVLPRAVRDPSFFSSDNLQRAETIRPGLPGRAAQA